MNSQLVHENGKRLLSWLFTKFFEVVYEVVSINSLWMNLSKLVSSFLWHGSYHWTITSVDILLINSQIRVLGWPLTQLDSKLREIDLIKVDQASSLFFGLIYLLNNILAYLNIVLTSGIWQIFFLSNFLSSDTIFEVKSSERSNSYSFVLEPSMESDLSLFHSKTSPLFECFRAQKIVKMLLIKLSFFLLSTWSFHSFKCLSANMLNFVFSQVQTLGNGLISSILASKRCWSLWSEPDK